MRTVPLRRLAALAGAALLLSPTACSRGGRPGASPRFPGAPVVLVSVDTLRSDRLPMYGYGKVETPALDALRKDSVLFERAYAHVPLTLPSHASVFTGLEPGGHGVLANSGYALGPGAPTLAELLKRAGYATGGAVSTAVLSGKSGIGRGFDLWDERVEAHGPVSIPEFAERPGGETARVLLDWIRPVASRPFLAFLHTYEPHAPYAAPEPFRSRYADPYDGEVAVSDAIVGKFLDGLKALGVYDRAIVLFLSDHGEGLGDHGENQHGIFLYRESIQVPLLLKLPGSAHAGTSISAPVQLSDVFTTVGDLLGLEGFPEHPGTFPLGALAAGAPAPDRRVFAENFSPRIRLGWSELRALVSERYHYVEAPTPELYDVAADPGQKTNLAPSKPPELRALVVETERRRTALSAPAPVDAETAGQLRSLGYLTGTPQDDGGARPDPKEVIGSFSRLEAAAALHQEGRSAEALPVLLEILEANPRFVDGWEVLANVYERLGRMDEALAALKRTVALSPPGPSRYVADVAALALRAGRPAAGLHVLRAEVYGRQEKLAEAEREYALELAAHPRSLEALTGLAIVAAARGDLAEAARRIDAMVKAVPTAEGYLTGVVSLRSFGRPAEAGALLAEGRRAFPADPRLARDLAAPAGAGRPR